MIELNIARTNAQYSLAGFCLNYPGKSLLDKRKTPLGSNDKVLTDHEVELVRVVYEMGDISIRKLAEKFEVSRSHIHDIVTFRRRPYAYSWDGI
jgi:predicted DNA binding protein